MESCVLA